MTTKKKAAGSKPAETEPAVVAGKEEAAAPVEPPSPTKLQLQVFDQAIRNFGQGHFAEAKAGFEEAMRGPAVHVKDKALSYLQVCLRKLEAPGLQLKTAEEYFTYGVERLNSRATETARQYLSKALQLAPDSEHILYTLALACGQAGDVDAAYENLKRAIELEPRNRVLARQDQEFAAFAQHVPAIRALLQGSQSQPF